MSFAPPWIQSLLEVSKVEGCFILKPDGKLALNRLPSLYDDGLFKDFGPRVVELLELVNGNYMPSNDLVLGFSGKLLCIRKSETCVLGLLAEPDASFTSLKLATNVALKQITPEVLVELSALKEAEAQAAQASATQAPAAKDSTAGSGSGKPGKLLPVVAGSAVLALLAVVGFFLIPGGEDNGAGSQSSQVDPDTVAASPGEPVDFLSVIGPELFTIRQDGVPRNVRLYGVDLPEVGQPFADAAVEFFRTEMDGGNIRIKAIEEDASGNIVAWVYTGGNPVSLNERLVAEGLAWHFFRFSLDAENLAKAQERARASGVGIWSEPEPLEPWNFRRINNQDS